MTSMWIIILCGVLTVKASLECTEDGIQKKCGDLEGLKPDKFLPRDLPQDVMELKKFCREEEPTISCYSNSLEICESVEMYGTRYFFIAAGELINRVCYGDLRAKYLRKAKCFLDVINKRLDISEEFNDMDVSKDQVNELYIPVIKRTCGREAVDLWSEYINIRWPFHLFRNDFCSDSSKILPPEVPDAAFSMSTFLERIIDFFAKILENVIWLRGILRCSS